MAGTSALSAQQIRNHSTVKDAESMATVMKRVEEAERQQGVPPNQATLLAPRHLHQLPPPLKKQNRKRRHSTLTMAENSTNLFLVIKGFDIGQILHKTVSLRGVNFDPQ